MWYQVFEYIKFIFNSTNQHGIHSPFIFDLVTKCFYDKKKYNHYSLINQFRKQLYQNDLIILVKDFGAGSRVFKTNARKISGVAKNAGITKKRAHLLYRLSKYLKPNSVLELGTSLGMATSAISIGNPEATITTIEGCPDTASIAKQQFEAFNLENINLIINNFDDELDTLKNQKFNLIYVDGNHQKDSTLNYFNSLLETINNDSLIIFDDIHWSKGMAEAWEIIKQHKKVTVTIDTFFWGFVFFRKEQVKQHFNVRL